MGSASATLLPWEQFFLRIRSGRRGKPVKKMRFMPMARAHELARKLQGIPGTTVSVL